MSALYLMFYKVLRKPWIFWFALRLSEEIAAIVLGFGFGPCFSNFELPGFVLLAVLELFRTSWFRSGSWKSLFVFPLEG